MIPTPVQTALRLAAIALVGACEFGAATHGEVALRGPEPNQTPSGPDAPQEVPPALEAVAADYEEAVKRAKAEELFLVVSWSRKEDPGSTALRTRILGDPEVRRWISDRALFVELDVDAPENAVAVKRNGIGARQIPALDLLDVQRELRLDRLLASSDALDFLAVTVGLADGDPPKMPTGAAAAEPMRWLGWANYRYAQSDERAALDAVAGYAWCLGSADAFRPGFRARYLEFLIRRISKCKRRTPEASRRLRVARDRLEALLRTGKATRRDVYELTRFNTWMRLDVDSRSLFKRLVANGESTLGIRRMWLPGATAILGRYRDFDDLLSTTGSDALRIFAGRIEGHRPTAEELDPELRPFVLEPLPHTIADTAYSITDDASWVFEALLARGREAEARSLHSLIAERFPSDEAYVSFVERAVRAKSWSMAIEVADLGRDAVSDTARARIERLVAKIPSDESATAPRGGGK